MQGEKCIIFVARALQTNLLDWENSVILSGGLRNIGDGSMGN